MNQDHKRSAMDMAAMIGVALLLLGTGFCYLFAVGISKQITYGFNDMEAVELPLISKYLLQAVHTPAYSAVPAILLLAGFWVLFVTKDRLRGMVYGIVFALLVAVLSVVVLFASILPLVKVIQMVG